MSGQRQPQPELTSPAGSGSRGGFSGRGRGRGVIQRAFNTAQAPGTSAASSSAQPVPIPSPNLHVSQDARRVETLPLPQMVGEGGEHRQDDHGQDGRLGGDAASGLQPPQEEVDRTRGRENPNLGVPPEQDRRGSSTSHHQSVSTPSPNGGRRDSGGWSSWERNEQQTYNQNPPNRVQQNELQTSEEQLRNLHQTRQQLEAENEFMRTENDRLLEMNRRLRDEERRGLDRRQQHVSFQQPNLASSQPTGPFLPGPPTFYNPQVASVSTFNPSSVTVNPSLQNGGYLTNSTATMPNSVQNRTSSYTSVTSATQRQSYQPPTSGNFDAQGTWPRRRVTRPSSTTIRATKRQWSVTWRTATTSSII